MKLCKYINFDIETKKITGEEKPAFCFFELVDIPTDYISFSTIENLNNYGFSISLKFDYKRVRDLIKFEVEAIGWEFLTTEQKLIAAIHKIGTNDERAAAFGFNFDLMDYYGGEYHNRAIECRILRLNAAKSKIHNRLGHIKIGQYTAPEIVLNELTESVILTYQNEGLGGLIDGQNAEGLLDYINETAGTSYELGGGLRSKAWAPFGFSNMSDFCDTLLNILKLGIY